MPPPPLGNITAVKSIRYSFPVFKSFNIGIVAGSGFEPKSIRSKRTGIPSYLNQPKGIVRLELTTIGFGDRRSILWNYTPFVSTAA